MTQKDFKIFYSWQSDINSKFNNHFIKDCLDKVVKDLAKNNSLEVIPTLDKDVKGETGSPNIIETILKKIDACQILVADVTIINSDFLSRLFNRRQTPNPNVLIELGYGLNRLSWDRIICLNNSYFSKVENLPFDLKQNRISQYHYGKSKSKEKIKKKLTDLLRHAIKEIIDNYEKIEEKSKSTNIISHDKAIFVGIDSIIKDDQFINLLQQIADNQVLTHENYRFFDTIYEFLRADRNRFLTVEIQDSADNFKDGLKKMRWTFSKNFHSKSVNWIDENGDEKNELIYTWSEFIDYKMKETKTEENLETLTDTVSKYKDFRLAVKKHLLI